ARGIVVHAAAPCARRLRERRAAARLGCRTPETVQGRVRRRLGSCIAAAADDDRADKGMTPLWSGRFDAAPDPAAFEFGASFRFDRRLFEDDVPGSIAWARALAKAGVLDGDDARRIEQTLTDILQAGRADAAFVDGPDEDVHSFVERVLVERLGDAGRRLHTGRSRSEERRVGKECRARWSRYH